MVINIEQIFCMCLALHTFNELLKVILKYPELWFINHNDLRYYVNIILLCL